MQVLISHPDENCSAFLGGRKVAEGAASDVAEEVRRRVSREDWNRVLVFSNATAKVIEIDFSGTLPQPPTAPVTEDARGPGRPKLGVVGREVTLLPRHWEWLELQPGGASVTLRRLVEEARKLSSQRDEVRRAQEVAYRFMSAMAGDRPNFEEATRALYAGNRDKFESNIRLWPEDIRDHALKLSAPAFVKEVAP